MPKVVLPEGLVELMKLERQYPDWERTPELIKDKMIRLALANGGFGSLHRENYLLYILNLTEDSAKGENVDKIDERLKTYAKLLYECYSSSLMDKKSTEGKYVNIYIDVEEYMAQNTKSSVSEATRFIAQKYKLTDNTVHRKYYEMRNKLKGISLEEIKRSFDISR